MKQTFLRTPGINGCDSFVARLADGCAVTIRLGTHRDCVAFDLMASGAFSDGAAPVPPQSFSLSSAGHLRPLADVLNAALFAHDTKYGIPPADNYTLPDEVAVLRRENANLKAEVATTRHTLGVIDEANKWQTCRISELEKDSDGRLVIIAEFERLNKLQDAALLEEKGKTSVQAKEIAGLLALLKCSQNEVQCWKTVAGDCQLALEISDAKCKEYDSVLLKRQAQVAQLEDKLTEKGCANEYLRSLIKSLKVDLKEKQATIAALTP